MSDLKERITELPPTKRALLEMKLKEKGLSFSGQRIIPRRDNHDLAPLSFAQQRLWFLQQLEPDSPVYNGPKALQLIGTLNVAALQKTLDAIVARISRTSVSNSC